MKKTFHINEPETAQNSNTHIASAHHCNFLVDVMWRNTSFDEKRKGIIDSAVNSNAQLSPQYGFKAAWILYILLPSYKEMTVLAVWQGSPTGRGSPLPAKWMIQKLNTEVDELENFHLAKTWPGSILLARTSTFIGLLYITSPQTPWHISSDNSPLISWAHCTVQRWDSSLPEAGHPVSGG